MQRILQWTFLLVILAGCGQEVDVAEFDPLPGEPVCVGRHSFVVPEGTNFRFHEVFIEGHYIIILPSDGRSVRAQMDRHGRLSFMGEPVVETTIGPWAFTIFDGTGRGQLMRYELGSLLIDDTLVLTFGLEEKWRFPDPTAVLPNTIHQTLRVAPYTGQREGFCASGLVFYGYEPERVEWIRTKYSNQERQHGWLDLRYGYGDAEQWAIKSLPPEDEGPFFLPSEVRLEPGREEWERIYRLGQEGILSSRRKVIPSFSPIGRSLGGRYSEIEISGVIDDPTYPHIELALDTDTGSRRVSRQLLLSLISGLEER